MKNFLLLLLFQATFVFSQSSVFFNDLDLQNDSLIYNHDTLFTGNYFSYENGKLNATGFVTNGLLDSISYFNEKGVLIHQTFFKNKVECSYRQYTNTIFTNIISNYKGNKLDGLWEECTLDGRLLTRGFYKDDKPIGQWYIYDKNGYLISFTDYELIPIVYKEYAYKLNFKKSQTVLVNVYYRDSNLKLIKREKEYIAKEDYLKLCRTR